MYNGEKQWSQYGAFWNSIWKCNFNSYRFIVDGGPGAVLPAWKVRDRGFGPDSGLRDGALRARPQTARAGISLSCIWMAVSSHSSSHPQEDILAQFSLYVHKGAQ